MKRKTDRHLEIYFDPSNYVDSDSADRFNISYLLLKIITLNKVTNYKLMSLIPELPDSYTSDPHLKSFLNLLIEGLSDIRSLRPSIDTYQKHQFLQVSIGINGARDDEEREYLEIVESIVGGNFVRR
jgi:hypothetical protein